MSALPPQVKERPILFSAPMVLALLAGTKTQTRRIAKFEQYEPGRAFNLGFSGLEAGFYHSGLESSGWVLRSRGEGGCWNDRTKPLHSPYGKAGDRLWVKETWRPVLKTRAVERIRYDADGALQIKERGRGWSRPKAARTGNVSPLFMPRWASRLTLEIASVRIERLREISDDDARAEGVLSTDLMPDMIPGFWANYLPNGTISRTNAWPSARRSFQSLWESINGAESWNANPWVWRVEFPRVVTHA